MAGRKKERKQKKPRVKGRFRVGDRVRVGYGVTDFDYPDMPLGGWAGRVTKVEKDHLVTVRWSPETLKAVHPVYQQRCEKDGLEVGEYLLEEGDLEPDPGGPLQIQHPTEITTRPLDPNDWDDRVRMALGLTGDDPLPDVDGQTLRTYYRYLAENMPFPFDSRYGRRIGSFERQWLSVTVTGLPDPGEYDCTEMYGLFCDVREGRRNMQIPLDELEVLGKTPARQMLADYGRWFSGYR